jgi:putative transposase
MLTWKAWLWQRDSNQPASGKPGAVHLPFRRRERAMLRFRQMKTLQRFASVHASVHNHFNQERHLTSRETYKANRSAALAEWQTLMA